jgi:hypothetical protein
MTPVSYLGPEFHKIYVICGSQDIIWNTHNFITHRSLEGIVVDRITSKDILSMSEFSSSAYKGCGHV